MKLNKKEWLLLLLPGFILIPAVFFPLSNDLTIFFLGGKSLNDGGRLYVDFIDLKPPLIYYISSLAIKIFGYSEMGIRIFDFIIQYLTCIGLYIFLKKQAVRFNAFLPPLLYAILYTSLGYTQTLQTESFLAPGLLLIMIFNRNDKFSITSAFMTGIIAGCLFSMKFTFGIILPGLLILDLTQKQNFKHLIFKKYIFVISAFILSVFISFVQLLDPEIYSAYINVLEYLKYYSNMPELNTATLTDMLKKTGNFFGDNFSLFMSFALFTGILNYLKSVNREDNYIINFSIVMFFLLLFTVLIERKLPIYHFSRIYFPAAIVSAYGIYSLITYLKSVKVKNKLYYLIIGFSLCFGLLLSPIPRWINMARVPYMYINNTEQYDSFYERDISISNQRVQQKEVAAYVKSFAKAKDKILVMTTGSTIINYFLRDYKQSVFTQSCFYISDFSPKNWTNDFIGEMNNSDILIMQKDDSHPLFNGHNKSTYDVIKSRKIFSSILEEKYIVIMEFRNYIVFIKSENKSSLKN